MAAAHAPERSGPTTLPAGPALSRPAHRRHIQALLIPPGVGLPAMVITVPDTAAGISDALGGGLFDDTTTGAFQSYRYAFYLDLVAGQSPPANLPDNPRAALLAARLGLHDRCVQARLSGPVLVTGLCPTSDDDIDVPAAVLAAAHRSGLVIAAPPVAAHLIQPPPQPRPQSPTMSPALGAAQSQDGPR